MFLFLQPDEATVVVVVVVRVVLHGYVLVPVQYGKGVHQVSELPVGDVIPGVPPGP